MITPLKIYKSEIMDGLGELLNSSDAQCVSALAYISEASIPIDSSIYGRSINSKDRLLVKAALGVKDDFDLFPIHTIMVSTGWNKNDDIFDGHETFAARKSPEDKPFNLGHDPNKIIGHITGSVAVDEQYNVIADETTDLPDYFHILTRAVIYKHVGRMDQALQDEVAELLEGIARNEWFVSMEALFTGFDYGLIRPDGQPQVIARQENTAFLTKHLRAYGGTGQYEDNRIGRVLRGITFSGKGLVKNPANPQSIIFNDTERFKGVLASKDDIQKLLITRGTSNMDEQILRELKDKNATLEQKLTAANKKLEEMGEAAIKAKLDSKDLTISELKSDVENLNKTIADLNASVKELEKSRDEAVASKIEIEEKLQKAEEKIAQSEAESLRTSRVSVLVDKGVDKAEAEELVASFDGLDDEKFNKLVEMQAKLIAAKCDDDDKEKEEKDKSDASESEESEDDDNSETEAETEETLSDAEEEEDAALASEESDDSKDELQTAIASFMEGYIGGDDDEQEDE